VRAEKIDQLSAKVDTRITQANEDRAAGDAVLAEKIDQLSAKVDTRITQANEDRAAGDAALSGKIDKLTERVLEMQGTQKGLVWFLTSVGLIAAGVSIARTLGWI
jgi:hypothetical protein